MEETTNKKKIYPSLAQKARIIALIESDKELQRGKFSPAFTRRDAERRWMAIAKNLNSLPGAKKTWTEWRKSWQDMKAAAKKKRQALQEIDMAAALVNAAGALECVVEFEETEKETERTLIKLVGEHECLWHPGDPQYSNKRVKDAIWVHIAGQLPLHNGAPLSPAAARRKWRALLSARAAARELDDNGVLLHKNYKYADLMSFLNDVDEFNDQYMDTSEPDEEPVEEGPLENLYEYDNDNQCSSPEEPERKPILPLPPPEPETKPTLPLSPAEPERKPTPPPTEKPQKKLLNRQEILHQRTIRRFQRYGLDPPNLKSELHDDSDSAPEVVSKRPRRTPEDGHTHFCLSLAPLMRSLPIEQVMGVRIKILQLLRDAMGIEMPIDNFKI